MLEGSIDIRRDRATKPANPMEVHGIRLCLHASYCNEYGPEKMGEGSVSSQKHEAREGA